jgi:hypothetical protein
MCDNAKVIAWTVGLVELPSILWAGYSFKIHKHAYKASFGIKEKSDNPFDEDVKSDEDDWENPDNDLNKELSKNIFSSSVPPLGKAGAWIIFLWTIVFVYLIFRYSYSSPKVAKRNFKILGYTHAVIVTAILVLTLSINLPLFGRAIPYFIIQGAVINLLINC